MAPVLHHHQLDFHPGPVNHAPSPLGFGFGLSSTSSNTSFASVGFGCAGPSTSLSPFLQSHAMNTPTGQPQMQRNAKRRHENDEDNENDSRPTRDYSMDRSPTPPDRPKRGVPKRARMIFATETVTKDSKGKGAQATAEDEVDVGILLASLPPNALLPILNSLISSHPEIKRVVIPLIPRPTLDTAVQAIAASAKKLRDAYPYSNTSASSTTTTFGFGSLQRPSLFADMGSRSSTSVTPTQGMRDDYILSRLAPHISEFVTTCMTYVPYFSLDAVAPGQEGHTVTSTHIEAKGKAHPNETFQVLMVITNHFISQPPLARRSLSEQLLSRLVKEWMAWIDRLDVVVNQEAGMFGQETVRNWERVLDEYSQSGGPGLEVFRSIRDRWISTVGWLVGRQLMMQQ